MWTLRRYSFAEEEARWIKIVCPQTLGIFVQHADKWEDRQTPRQWARKGSERWDECIVLFYKFVRRYTLQGLIPHLLSLPPFQVLGGVESRGVLKKISDMLEVILKRIDNLSKLDNTSTSDAKRLDELSSAISRYAEFPNIGPPCPSCTPCCLSVHYYLTPMFTPAMFSLTHTHTRWLLELSLIRKSPMTS